RWFGHRRRPWPRAAPENIQCNDGPSQLRTARWRTQSPRQWWRLPPAEKVSCRTWQHDGKGKAAVALPAPATPASLPSRPARQTSPETEDCGPGCAPVAPVLPPARTEYPDAAGPPATALCFAPVVPSRLANPTGPAAGPLCSRKTPSGSLSPPIPDWPTEIQSPHPAARSTAPAISPTPPV